MSCVRMDYLFRAQFGEDRILWKVFRERPQGFFIEVGAYDGITLSNTYFLEQMGWHGLLVEPIKPLADQAAMLRTRSRVVNAACSRRGTGGEATFTITQNVPVLSFLSADADHVERCRREGAQLIEVQVPARSLTDILLEERSHPSPAGSPWVANQGWSIDIVSIDTEGCELDVLDGFELERFRPRVLVIENDRPSGAPIEPYLNTHGYAKFHRCKINDFYVNARMCNDDLTLAGLEDALPAAP